MLRKLLAIVALMIWAISVLQGEEIWIEQVGEVTTNNTNTVPQYPTPLTWKDFYEIRPPRAGDPNLNAITKEPLSNSYIHFAVGDRGKVFKIDGFGGYVADSMVLLGGAYNFTGVSFAPNTYTGWIVGYNRDNWQGLILKTVDTGRTWIPQSYPQFPGNIAVPFLDVWAVNENYVWISCAHGYVLWTRNGGLNWYRTPAKPGGDTHYGWLWGVWAYDTATAWVCSDQSGFVVDKNYLK